MASATGAIAEHCAHDCRVIPTAIEASEPDTHTPPQTREIWHGYSNNHLNSEMVEAPSPPVRRNTWNTDEFVRIRDVQGADSHIWERRAPGYAKMPDFSGMEPVADVPVDGTVIAIAGVSIGLDKEA